MRELILTFHGVGDIPEGVGSAETGFWWDEKALRDLLDDLPSVLECARPNSLGITFDDGNISDVEIVLPELVSRNLKAVFFVCAGRIGQRGYLSKSALLDLISAGMDVGSHGMSHRDWRRTSDKDLHNETSVAKTILEDVCEQEVPKASIPFGSYDRRVLAKLRATGFKEVYSSDGGFAKSQSWLKPRNTLERNLSCGKVCQTLHRRSSLSSRLYRLLKSGYKSLR